MQASLRLSFLFATLLLARCAPASPSSGAPDGGARLEVRPGVGIGPVAVGMRYAEVATRLGPLEGGFVNNRLGFGRYNALGLEVVFVSAEDSTVSEDALVIGVGAIAPDGFSGPVLPGQTRASVTAAFGPPDDLAGASEYYVEGFSVEYDGDRVSKVGVFRPYQQSPTPPEMRPYAAGGSQ